MQPRVEHCACGRLATQAVVYESDGTAWGRNATCDEHVPTYVTNTNGGRVVPLDFDMIDGST